MKFLEKEGYLEYLNEGELILCVKDALEKSLRKLDHKAVDWLIIYYGNKLKTHFGREEYLNILLNKNEAEIIIELGKIIGKDIIIEEYRIDRLHISGLSEEYRDTKRNPFTEYSIEVEDKFVVRLNLSDCGLNSFPKIITELIKLETLILNGNELKEISKSILDMKYLRFVSIARCGIQNIPNWFKNLKLLKGIYLLEGINLSGNPLNERSKELIKNFKNIEYWVN